jgi:lipoprotein-releasing system permease protein|tara:strand:+ start:2623 stop:3774 length:1152 start_codon:yes stop_codon:yes gene_type:complete
MLGLILGVAVLLVVLSVMNGFDKELRERVLGVLPHGAVVSRTSMQDWQQLRSTLEAHPQVLASAPFINGSALLMSQQKIQGVSFSGIEPDLEREVSIVGEFFIEGTLEKLNQTRFGIAIGQPLADKLELSVGDQVTMVLPEATLTLVGPLPRLKRFTLVGIFRVGADIDRTLVLMHMRDAAKILKLPDGAQGIRVLMQDLFVVSQVLRELLLDLNGDDLFAQSWMHTIHGNLYQAIRMQKSTMYLLLLLVVAVAVFNVVSSLVMMVTDKKGDIAILRTLGASPTTIAGIFVLYGTMIGLIGVLLGATLGISLSWWISDIYLWIEKTLQLNIMSEYFINYLPSQILLGDVLSVCGVTVMICCCATIFPAIRAASANPAEALRYE